MPTQADVTNLVRTHQREIWRYLCLLGCEAALAEDLLQETFVSVLERPFDVRGSLETVAYLRTVARNLFFKSNRATRRMNTVDIEALDAAWEVSAGTDGGESYVEALRDCLNYLDQRSREAIDLRYRDEAEGAEIAAALGLTEAAAKTLMHRARASLRECIEHRIGGET